jgi:plastocyanin
MRTKPAGIGAIVVRNRIDVDQFSRVRVIGLGLMFSLASCGGAAPTDSSAGGTSVQPVSAPSSPTAVASLQARPTATASPPPEFTSTTESATAAPVDAIDFEMAGPPPHYLPKELVAPSGGTVFFVSNTSLGTHNIAIARGPLRITNRHVTNVPSALSGNVLSGHKATFSIDAIPPGSYVFWCTISDHAAEGMHGTLTVNP